MSMGQNIRILPILIIVAMLAFSVRLVDFATGVSGLSGAALAAKNPVEPAPEDVKAPSQADLPRAGDMAPPVPEPEKGGENLAQAEAPQEEAQAEKAAEKPADAPAPDAKPEDKAEEKAEAKMDAKAEAKTESKDGPSVKWRDAGDEELETEKDKMAVMEDLAARRDDLDTRENELKTREALLKVTEQEIARKYQELTQLRTEIENLLDKQTEEEKARIVSLVKIYEGMKPKEAARIFDTLDVDVLMSVMSKMSERKLSPIIAAMNPERAKTMTILLAQEKQLPELPRAE